VLSFCSLETCVSLASTSQAMRSFVSSSGLRHVQVVDLTHKPGTAVGPALSSILASEGLLNLTTIRAAGSAARPPLLELCTALAAEVDARLDTASNQATARRGRTAPVSACDTSIIAPRRAPVPDVGRARLATLTALSLDSVKQLCEADLRALLPHTPRESGPARGSGLALEWAIGVLQICIDKRCLGGEAAVAGRCIRDRRCIPATARYPPSQPAPWSSAAPTAGFDSRALLFQLCATDKRASNPPLVCTTRAQRVRAEVAHARCCGLAPACASRGPAGLQLLSLPRCSRLGDAAAVCVATHCPRLRVAVCSDWTSLSDGGVAALAGGCLQLEDLSLDGCLRVGRGRRRGRGKSNVGRLP
jgi:hypothetical protein